MNDERDVLDWVRNTGEDAERGGADAAALLDGLTDAGLDVPSEAARYVRRNVWDMSGAQYNQLRTALDSLNTVSNPVLGRFWFLHRVLGDIVHVHGERRFLPWHRLMLWKLEQAIRASADGSDLYLPYWTWWQPAGTGSAPGRKGVPAFWADYRPAIRVPEVTDSGMRTLLVALQTAGVRQALGGLTVVQMRERITGALSRGGRSIAGGTIAVTRTGREALRSGGRASSSAGSVDLPTRSRVRAALTHTGFAAFSDDLEDVHGTPHVWVGNNDSPDGVMRSPEWSPADILFYFHHCEIDRLWRVWQGRHGVGRAWSVTGATLPPWTESIADVLDPANGPLGFDYENRTEDDPGS